MKATQSTESATFYAVANDETVDATFINQYNTSTIALQGTKEWQDWENNNFRPEIVNGKVGEINLTVTRTAASQDGQDNDLSERLTEDEDYVVTWSEDPDNQDQWIYTIKAKEENSGELAQYAPNGMPWTYTVTEKLSGGLENIYNGGNKKVTINGGNATGPDGNLVAFAGQNLVNSMRTSAVFQKKWQDENGDSVTSNYLGNVTITYALQVSNDGGRTWTDADTFFTDANSPWEDGGKPAFEDTITQPANASAGAWRRTIDDLPTAIKNESSTPNYTLLEYRVVERTITYALPGQGGMPVTVTVKATPPDNGDNGQYNLKVESENSLNLITGAELAVSGITSTSTNTLATVDLEVTKTWVDDDNRYNTRPEGEGVDWSVTFLVQYSMDGTTWSPFLVPAASGDGTVPLTVTVTGSDANNSGTQTVHDLPAVSTWQYRAVELDSDYAEEDIDNIGDYIVQDGGMFNTGYKTTYGDNPTTEKSDEDKVTKYKSSATNTLLTTSVSVKKQWTANTPEDGKVPVQMEVQYLAADGTTWRPISGTRVTLGNGEHPAWTHTWSGLPQYMPGSDTTTGQTQYQVVEISGDGYEEEKTSGTGTEENPFVITNKAVVDYTVRKVWNGTPADVDGWSVTVQLYRSVNGVRDETYSENATLSRSNSWQHTFENLDKYDENQQPYTYYAEEISVTVGAEKIDVVDDAFTVTLGDGTTLDFAVDYNTNPESDPNTTIITNRTAGQIAVTKHWWDEGGETSRPKSIIVGLYIRVGDQLNAYPSTDDHFTITLNKENNWTGTFEDLPEYDSNGNKITYVVRELENGTAVEESGNLGDYTVHYGGTGEIHNFRYDDLILEKVLLGAAADPDKEFHFTAEFEYPGDMPHGGPYTYQISESDGLPTPEVGTISSGGGEIILKGGQYAAINGLSAGTKYTITETEANQEGYATSIEVNGNTVSAAEGTVSVDEEKNRVTFTNVRDPGTLIVEKQVMGYGNTGKDWHFTIQLTGPDGQLWKDSVKAALSDGTTVKLEFNGQGEAAFTLKHGQTLRIDSLPNGTAYQVTETEANRDGYTTTMSGDAGTITGEGTSYAKFVNDKPGGGGGATPTPRPSESPTPSESPEPSGSPAPSESPEPSDSPEPSGTPGPSASPVPSGTPAVSQSPSPTGTPEPGDTPDDTPTTGDPTHTGLWLGLGGLSLGALVW